MAHQRKTGVIAEKKKKEDLTNPRVWGRPVWYVMKIIVKTYPVSPSCGDERAVRRWFHAFKNLLPCERCRNNYGRVLRKYPIQTGSRTELRQWFLKMKRTVERHVARDQT